MNLKRLIPKPTYRETARYLDRVIEDLKKKHGTTNSDEFEKDLVNITGIGLRQVRTYKNSPKPHERLKDNSLVLAFVLAQRKKDIRHKGKLFAIFGSIVCLISFITIWLMSRPTQIETFGIREMNLQPLKTDPTYTSKVYIKIPRNGWLLRVGPLKNSRIDRRKMTCSESIASSFQTCTMSETTVEGILTVTIIVDNELIRTVALILN